MARHSESLEELVVYCQEYGDHGLWVRPKEVFVFINIPAHTKHRVVWTAPDDPMVWLAVHYEGAKCNGG